MKYASFRTAVRPLFFFPLSLYFLSRFFPNLPRRLFGFQLSWRIPTVITESTLLIANIRTKDSTVSAATGLEIKERSAGGR